MARSKKHCDFCSGDYESEYIMMRNGYCLWAEVYPFNNVISVLAQANDEDGYMMENHIDIQMNYCPVCGRKLTD